MSALDELIEESRAIHDEFLKTIGRLEAFSEALSVQAGKLRDEIGSENAGSISTGNESPESFGADSDRQRAGSDGGDTAGE